MKCVYCRDTEYGCDGCCSDCEKRLRKMMAPKFDDKASTPNSKYFGSVVNYKRKKK